MIEPELAGIEMALRRLDAQEVMDPYMDTLHQHPDALDAVCMIATDMLPALMIHSR